MASGIYSALSGAIVQQRSLDVTANNVANANTDGYRADRVSFKEQLFRNGQAEQAPKFVTVGDVRTNVSSGSFRETGNPLDLAIEGDGFFALDTPAGERYTRAGSMRIGPEGMLMSSQGEPVLSVQGSPIVVPPQTTNVSILADGTVNADDVDVGQLQLVRFTNPAALVKTGATLFQAPPEAGMAPTEESQIVQGFVEASNVNVVGGMNEIIHISRSFEALERVIQTFRDLDKQAAREIGSRR